MNAPRYNRRHASHFTIETILLGDIPQTYERELNTVFVDFPRTLDKGREYAIDDEPKPNGARMFLEWNDGRISAASFAGAFLVPPRPRHGR